MKRYPKYERPLFFTLSLRSAFVLAVQTSVSYFYCRGKVPLPISILKDVPRGFVLPYPCLITFFIKVAL